MSQVEHKNIVHYYESFLDQEDLVIAMEYAEKGDLAKMIKSQSE